MKKHEQPGFDFTKGLTPEDMLKRLKEFALYGLDECLEVEQLMEKLEIQQELLILTQEACTYWQKKYFAIADMSTLDPGED